MKKRVSDTSKNLTRYIGGALQDRANDPELEARMLEEEEREKDDKEDKDDEETREKALYMDEYKDDHR